MVSDTGHIVLDGTVRTGESQRSWYRGPFVPRAVNRRPAEAVHVADQLRRVAEDGRIELGEAAAFELGRLLALSAPSMVSALREWRQQGFVNRRGTRVGAGSLLAGLLGHWEVTLGIPVGAALGSRLLTTVGAPEVAPRLLPARELVDPLPPLAVFADPARTVATGLSIPVRDVRASFAGVVRPAVTAEQLEPGHRVRLRRAARRPQTPTAGVGPAHGDGQGAVRVRALHGTERSASPRNRSAKRGGAMRPTVEGKVVLKATLDAALAAGDSHEGADLLPSDLTQILVRLRVLEGVPFEYLVPDEELLPAESIRFFYLDRNWTDALIQGVLTVGATTTRDRIDVAARWPGVRDEVDQAEHDARAHLTGAGPVLGEAESVTGFLVRSRAISGWPGVQVRAYRRTAPEQPHDPLSGLEEMRLLRLERLAPAVLLALVDGIPDQVHLEEPRVGIQFGVDEAAAGELTVALKDPATGERVQHAGHDVTVPVPFRKGSPGVVSISALAQSLLAADTGHVLGGSLSPAEYALQMLQLPYRQVFGETDAAEPLGDVLTVPAALEITTLTHLWEEA